MLLHTSNVNTHFPNNFIHSLNFQKIVVATVVQLIKLRELLQSQDPIFDGWQYYLTTQLIQNLSVITACIPYVKNLFLAMKSGFFQTGDFHLRRATKNDDAQDPQQLNNERQTIESNTIDLRRANVDNPSINESRDELEFNPQFDEDLRRSSQSQTARIFV